MCYNKAPWPEFTTKRQGKAEAMKILQFTPPPAATNTHKGPDSAGRAAGGDFASLLKQQRDAAESKPSHLNAPAAMEYGRPVLGAPAGVAGGVISLENQRALKLPPLNDLGQAGQLLGRLDSDIRAATPEMLNRVHNLEGLVYVYTP
jgi:hypothetical protein